MALKIRCPHCMRVLVAATEAAGQTRICPACSQLFNVPLPRAASEPPAPEPAVPRCPRCQTEVAPTARICHRCHTDLATGRRLPLGRRLRLLPLRTWGMVGAATATLILAAAIGVRLYGIHGVRPKPHAAVTSRPADAAALRAAADDLLRAASPEARRVALARLSAAGPPAAAAVTAALADSLDHDPRDPPLRHNRVAAIDFLAQLESAVPPECLATLARCESLPELRAAALRARALLGDSAALDDLADVWLEQLRRVLLLRAVLAAADASNTPAARLVMPQATEALTRSGAGLRRLELQFGGPVFERLASAYWASWSWLGQGRGDRLADAVFDLAQPDRTTLEFRPEDVRQPRDVMKRVATSGAPDARAAAGLILEQRGPQYQTLARSIGRGIAELIPNADAADQQRLTWAAARLSDRLFGTTAHADPLDIPLEEIRAAQEWARPGTPPVLKPPYPTPPVLSYRAVTPASARRRELLAEMQRDWDHAAAALDLWLAEGLGLSPAVRELLDRGPRRVNRPAVAAAMVLAAAANEQSLRPQLEWWCDAGDQPAWLRGLAYTVLGSLDARRGTWPSGWPNGLDVGDPARLDAAPPGWRHFGRVIAAGGPAMRARLKTARPPALSRELATRLLAAAEAETPGGAPGP